MKKATNIYLIGFSGSGKSTVGRLLAAGLKVRFADTDALIEKKQKQSIVQIFENSGEKFFRKAESEVIAGLATGSKRTRVIALGGGALEDRANRECLAESGITIYLRCLQREIYRRIKNCKDRPLLVVKPRPWETQRLAVIKKIGDLLRHRRVNYKRADITISTTDLTPAAVVKIIVTTLRSRGWHVSK